MSLKLKIFDPAEYLTDDGTVEEYLRLSLETNDPKDIVESLSNVARARGGIAKLAQGTGLSTDLLQQALSESGNPDLITLTRILQGLGVTLSVSMEAPEPLAA